MVGIFASLKWRLVTNRIRRASGGARAGMIVVWVVVLLVLAGSFFGFVALRSAPDTATVTVVSLFTVQFLAWGMAPLIAFGVDETVDPTRFALLPLRPRTLQAGLLVSSLVGYLPLVNAIVLVGASIAMAPSWGLLPVALVCSAAQLVLCVVFSRALSSSVAQLMSGRRGRDLGVLLGFVLVVAYMLLSLTLNSQAGAEGFGSGVQRASGVLTWLPPGALASLPRELADGSAVHAIASVLIVLATAAVLFWWWSVAIRRLLTNRPSVTTSSAPAGHSTGDSVATTLGGTVRLIAGRDRVLAWRDPMRRVPWLFVAFFGIAWPLLVIHGAGAVFGVALAAAMAGTQAANAYGMDGSALWLHITSFADRTRARGELLGHALYAIVPGVVVIAVSLPVVAAIRGGAEYIPAAAGVCLSALFGGAAVAGYLSARLPYAMRQRRNSMFSNAVEGQKGRTSGATFGLLGGAAGCALPSAGCAVLSLTVSPLWGWLGILVALVVGAVALTVFSGAGSRLYLERSPEIFAVVSRGDRN